MFVEDRGLVYDATRQPPSRGAASFCELTRLDDAALLCVFQVGPCKNDATSTLHLCRSDDDGQTWTDLPSEFETRFDGTPGSLGAGVVAEVEPGRLILMATWWDRSEPDRPLFDPETQGVLHSKLLRAFSTDRGESWTSWDEVPAPGLSGYSLTGPILRWPDGTLGVALESYKEFDDPEPRHHAAWLFLSRDGGQTFPNRALVAQHPEHRVYYWDQRLCVGPATGELVGMFWTHDLQEQQDLNVHLRRASLRGDELIASPIEPTSIPGQIGTPVVPGRWTAGGAGGRA